MRQPRAHEHYQLVSWFGISPRALQHSPHGLQFPFELELRGVEVGSACTEKPQTTHSDEESAGTIPHEVKEPSFDDRDTLGEQVPREVVDGCVASPGAGCSECLQNPPPRHTSPDAGSAPLERSCANSASSAACTNSCT